MSYAEDYAMKYKTLKYKTKLRAEEMKGGNVGGAAAFIGKAVQKTVQILNLTNGFVHFSQWTADLDTLKKLLKKFPGLAQELKTVYAGIFNEAVKEFSADEKTKPHYSQLMKEYTLASS